jgi:hypothetical protein
MGRMVRLVDAILDFPRLGVSEREIEVDGARDEVESEMEEEHSGVQRNERSTSEDRPDSFVHRFKNASDGIFDYRRQA